MLGHEVAATILQAGSGLGNGLTGRDGGDAGALCSLRQCASCRSGRPNACCCNQTLGVQRDGASDRAHRNAGGENLRGEPSLKELCLVEPLTVGFHAAARGRVTERDVVAVFGCGGVGLGAISAAAFRGARVIAIDMDDAKLEIARKAGASDWNPLGQRGPASRLSETHGWTWTGLHH